MGLLEKLKDIINVDLRGAKFIEYKKVIILNQPEKKEKVVLDEETKEISFNYPSLQKEEQKLLTQSLKEEFDSGEIKEFLERTSEERVEDVRQKLPSVRNQRIIDFYKEKILPKHLRALEAALYVRSIFETGSSVAELKKEIIRKFGEDGKNILNLCTAGYFEGYIKQVYEEMAFSDSFTIEKFQDFFTIITQTSPFAIFVSKDMSEGELSGEVNYKIQTHRRYGIKFLAIHGIGRNNIRKIHKIVQELEEETDLRVMINQDRNVIIVKVLF